MSNVTDKDDQSTSSRVVYSSSQMLNETRTMLAPAEIHPYISLAVPLHCNSLSVYSYSPALTGCNRQA
ncbi:hypothetical protein JR316_0011204 [Psilocybe cubensis]|uniref:Uncharacterized protein n=1 Tax=Psilocybe cubensis TaxID=181762 RepID=A0ACB8GJH1_PSICU|nr:hypothetical protein JR316_0011204 [Psilocybe cubensis]KAH9475649.1 hypothetical protein JR316_0011204 [Psilocybe cubensis]